ncbi:hypothetical protein BGX28_002971 [Mortierella sp. GBA30]|nr:hypothetical protein BGX28_002971 [Mortierella sp. GBA30]
MKNLTSLQNLYTRTGTSTLDSATGHLKEGDGQEPEDKTVPPPSHYPHFPPPSILQRASLNGILYRPSDAWFIIRILFALLWAVIRLHYVELPYHIVTRFRYSSKQHPAAWSWWNSVFFALLRTGAAKIDTLPRVRFVGHFLDSTMRIPMVFQTNVKITKDVRFKVNLDILLRPERATLKDLREDLKRKGFSDDVLQPSKGYLESMHPPKDSTGRPRLANLPEEVGALDNDGTYTLKGEWVEILDDPKKKSDTQRPRSKTVILHFHGGAQVFCNPKTHAQLLTRLGREIGPGTRAFSVDYRLSPEDPFPAAIHDAFAAYLYLTEPDHAALVLDEDSAVHELAVDPRDIVVTGDSAGGLLAVSFFMYLIQYVQPSTMPRFILPHALVLMSPLTDFSSSLPSTKCFDWYCYCPGPIGTSPVDKKEYIESKKQNFASYYLCGDSHTSLNPRNALGLDRRWEWYSHLVQHPLVSPAHSVQGLLEGFPNVMVQTATYDRLVDDGRLFAHRVGLQNPGKLVRIENYKEMVHVHQMLSMFEAARVATKNMARFLKRSRYLQEEEEDPKTSSRSFASLLRKIPVSDQLGTEQQNGKTQLEENSIVDEEELPAFLLPSMVTEKSAADKVEWVMVEQNGKEYAGDEGVDLDVLINSWPVRGYDLKEA